MKRKTYQLDVPARGVIHDGGAHPFAFEAGEHQARNAEDELVLEHLVKLGVAKHAVKPRPKAAGPEQQAADEPAEETGSVI